MTLYLASCAMLLIGSIAVRSLPVTPRVAPHDEHWFDGTPLDPRAVAFLRGGVYAVVLTALAELHAAGAVDATVRARPVGPLPPESFDDDVLRSVYAGVARCTEPRLVALLPSVRRAVRAVRPELERRRLLVPVRRHVFALVLLGYAAGLAVAGLAESGLAESGRQLSTVVGTAGVLGLAGLAVFGPRRTVAGQRVLRAERRLLAEWVAVDRTHPRQLLTAMVAAHGRSALELLCTNYVGVGALARRPVQPVRLVPGPISIRIPAPRRPRVPAGRPVYESVSEGPAIRVRPAFAEIAGAELDPVRHGPGGQQVFADKPTADVR